MFIFNFIKNLNKRRKNFRKKNKEILRKKTIIKSIKNSSVGTNYSTFYDTNNALSKLCEKYGTDKGFVELKKKHLMDGCHIHIVYITIHYFFIVEKI